MRKVVQVILLIVLFSSCTNGELEEKWADELAYATKTSCGSYQVVNDLLEKEEERNNEDFRRKVLSYTFDVIGEYALNLERRLDHCNAICDSVLTKLSYIQVENEFDYSELREEVMTLRDSLTIYIATYIDDKGNDYTFDPDEIDENRNIAIQLSFSDASSRDTAVIRQVYEILDLPRSIIFEENKVVRTLQHQMILNQLFTLVNRVKSICGNHILDDFQVYQGHFYLIEAFAVNEGQIFTKEDSILLKIRMAIVEDYLRDENYYNLNNENFLFKENSLTIKVSEKGPQKITGTLGVAEKGVLIQKPWSYIYHVK